MTNHSIQVLVALTFCISAFWECLEKLFYLPIFAEGGQLKLVKLSFDFCLVYLCWQPEWSCKCRVCGKDSSGQTRMLSVDTPKDSSVSVVSESISKMPNLLRLVNFCILVYPVYQACWKHGSSTYLLNRQFCKCTHTSGIFLSLYQCPSSFCQTDPKCILKLMLHGYPDFKWTTSTYLEIHFFSCNSQYVSGNTWIFVMKTRVSLPDVTPQQRVQPTRRFWWIDMESSTTTCGHPGAKWTKTVGFFMLQKFLYIGACQNPGSQWVTIYIINLFIFMKGTLYVTFMIHCYSVSCGMYL